MTRLGDKNVGRLDISVNDFSGIRLAAIQAADAEPNNSNKIVTRWMEANTAHFTLDSTSNEEAIEPWREGACWYDKTGREQN